MDLCFQVESIIPGSVQVIGTESVILVVSKADGDEEVSIFLYSPFIFDSLS